MGWFMRAALSSFSLAGQLSMIQTMLAAAMQPITIGILILFGSWLLSSGAVVALGAKRIKS